MKRIMITGGTGFIGQSLSAHLAARDMEPVVVARHRPKRKLKYQFIPWDGIHTGEWSDALSGCHAIVNLAGRSVDCVKTPENADAVLRSRVDTTKAIGEALKSIDQPPRVWIQMSTAHIHGDSLERTCTESSTLGYGLAPFVGKAWENTHQRSCPESCRSVVLRTSFVIGRNGGAMKQFKKIVRLGLGGTVGHGRQGMSWIHEYDMNELICQSIVNEKYQGVYMASSPNPVSNQVFMKTLRKVMKMPIGLPAPSFAVKLGARYILRTDHELALYGRYVRSERLDDAGYEFRYPQLESALESLM